jgi:beta-glucosidase-like glycosyl hydrolase
VKKIRHAALILILASAASYAQSSYSATLSRQGKLGIPLSEAKALESKIGQLLIVNVDGFGYTGSLALEPGFVPMMSDLQIGGVIPHYGSTNYERIRRTNRALQEMTVQPLLICSDIVKVQGSGNAIGSFGDGYVGGFLGKFRALDDAALATLARLNAFAFVGMGVNVALGPTVDTSTGGKRIEARARIVLAALQEFGLEPVIKHFPFLPSNANLHQTSPDTKVPLRDAEGRFAVFGKLASITGIMMSTHLFDTLVDKELATFSSRWSGILRSSTGFKGLLMSDGLLMLKNYADSTPLAGGPSGADVAGVDETALWAARAILAGHDMVIVEGSAAQTVRVFDGLLALACKSTALGRQLRARIEQSYDRIVRFKKDRAKTLRRAVDVSPASINALISLLPTDAKTNTSFHFDPAALGRLAEALKAAAVRR